MKPFWLWWESICFLYLSPIDAQFWNDVAAVLSLFVFFSFIELFALNVMLSSGKGTQRENKTSFDYINSPTTEFLSIRTSRTDGKSSCIPFSIMCVCFFFGENLFIILGILFCADLLLIRWVCVCTYCVNDPDLKRYTHTRIWEREREKYRNNKQVFFTRWVFGTLGEFQMLDDFTLSLVSTKGFRISFRIRSTDKQHRRRAKKNPKNIHFGFELHICRI